MIEDNPFDYDKLEKASEEYYETHKDSPAAREFMTRHVNDMALLLTKFRIQADKQGFTRGEFGMIMTMGIEVLRYETKNKEDFEKWFSVVRKQTRDLVQEIME